MIFFSRSTVAKMDKYRASLHPHTSVQESIKQYLLDLITLDIQEGNKLQGETASLMVQDIFAQLR